MKLLNNKSILIWFLAFLVMVLPEVILAQGPPSPPSPPGGGGPPCWPPPCVPINNGLIFLAFAALLIATYQLKILRTKTK